MVAAEATTNLVPANAQHIGARHEQQDAFGFSDPSDSDFVAHGGLLAVVADGMGGMAQGDIASKTAVARFLSAYMTKTPGESIPAALSRALTDAASAVLNLARENDLVDEMGTTLVAAVVLGRKLYWISAGDSRLYLVREGYAIQLTIDHVYARELDAQVAAGLISRSDAAEHPERDHLTSYLGKLELTAIDRSVRPFPLDPGDLLVLCSDGLYKDLTDSEIARVAERNGDAVAEELVESVLSKNSPRQDNVTVLTLAVPSPEPTADAGGTTGPEPRPRVSLVRVAVLALVLLVIGAAVFWWLKAHPSQSDRSDRPAQRVGQPPSAETQQTAPSTEQKPAPGVDSPAQSGRPNPAPATTTKERHGRQPGDESGSQAGPDQRSRRDAKPEGL